MTTTTNSVTTKTQQHAIVLSVEGRDRTVRDVTVTIHDETMAVGQLSELLGFGPHALMIDGRRLPASASIYEARLWNGAMVTPAEGRPEETAVGPEAGAVIAIEQVAGLDAGTSLALVPGRYEFGPSLTEAGHTATSFELDVDADGGCVLHPAGPVQVDGRTVEDTTPVDDAVISLGTSQFVLTELAPSQRRTPASPSFHRSPRRNDHLPANAFEVPAGPKLPGEPPRLSWVMMLAPLPAALVMAYFFNPRFALFAAMGPIMVLARWFEGRRSLKKQQSRFDRELAERSVALDQQLTVLGRDTAAALRRANPSTPELLRRAHLHDPRLWERRPGHSDFACLSVGHGSVAWQPGSDNTSRLDPVFDPVLGAHASLSSVPIVVDLRTGPLGIVGRREQTLASARALLVAAAVASGPHDLPLVLASERSRAADWDWLKWLPHLGRPARVPQTAAALDAIVAKLATEPVRHQRDESPGPLPIVVVDGMEALRRKDSHLRRALAGDHGLSAIVVADNADDLPASCTSILEIGDDGLARFTDIAHSVSVEHVTPAGTPSEVAAEAARAMAWMTDPDGGESAVDLPERVLLPELLDGIGSHATLARWAAAGTDPNPVATVGVGAAGPLVVDLVSDGPHGLLAGTTGAGKSEFLRTFVASMASAVSADHVNFVLIDYKGGGAFDVCADLPHTVAVVTDLDDHLGERALRSLQAELTHRERLFRSADVHDVGAYRATGRVLPRLVVIVDEFATLAAELPDFLGALVDIAQRGRSLGIHLMLATQRPAGVLDNKIRANTNLRISLRVQDENDSLDVIGIDAAAKLGRDDLGRGFLRFGASDVVPFQAAYVGGRSPDASQRRTATRPFTLVEPDIAVDPWSVPVVDDLQRMVAHICDAHHAGGYGEPRRPWLPTLPDRIDAESLPAIEGVPIATDASGASAIAFGLVDIPSEQSQRSLLFDLDAGNAVVYGMDPTVTAATLATITMQLVSVHSPDELHVFVVDQGKRLLAPLSQLPHCGASVTVDDVEMVSRLVDVLEADIADRRAAKAGHRRTVVVAEGLGALFETLNDSGNTDTVARLAQILRDGPNLGLTVVGSSSHERGIPARIANQVAAKYLHEMATPAAYTAFGLRPKDTPSLSGHGIIDLRSGHVGVAAVVDDLAAAVRATPVPIRIQNPPATIRVVGTTVAASELTVEAARTGDRVIVPVGLAMATAEDVTIEIEDRALVIGPSGAGKTTALAHIVDQFIEADPTVRVVGVGASAARLGLRPGIDVFVAADATELPPAADTADLAHHRTLVVIDDADRLSSELGKDLEALSRRAGQNLWMVAASRPDGPKDLSSWLKAFRGCRSGLALAPQPSDGEAFRTALPLRSPKRFPSGRGFAISGGVCTLAQMAQP